MNFFIAGYFFLFAFLALRRPAWAFLLVAAALPSYLIRFSLGPVPMTLLEGMILILAVVRIWQGRKERIGREIFQKKHLPIFAFLLVSMAAVWISPNTPAALGIWKAYFFEPILFFFLLRYAFRLNMIAPRDILRAFSVSALMLSLFALFQKFTGFWIPSPWADEAVRRVTSIFEYPNALGLFLGPLVLLFIGQALCSRCQVSGVRRNMVIGYWLLVIALCFFSIVFAHSTGALVGIAAGGIFFYLLRLIKRRKESLKSNFTFYLLPFTFLIIITTLFVFRNTAVRDEFLMRDWSGQVRRTIWSETWQMLKDRPIAGAGLAGYQTAIEPYHRARYLEIFLYPHNIFLNFWSEMGIAGLGVFFWLMAVFFRAAWKTFLSEERERSAIAACAMAAMIALLVHGLVDVPYFKNDLSVLFWILYALGVL